MQEQALDAFDHGGDTHAATDAKRDQSGVQIAPFQFVQNRSEQHCTGGANRVAKCDGAAVDVHHFRIEFLPPLRTPNKLKYLASVESGAGTFINDTLAEEKAI